MNIIFSNGKEFEYTQAFGLERDFKDGYTRPSMEIHMPIAQTSYNEIENTITKIFLENRKERICYETVPWSCFTAHMPVLFLSYNSSRLSCRTGQHRRGGIGRTVVRRANLDRGRNALHPLYPQL